MQACISSEFGKSVKAVSACFFFLLALDFFSYLMDMMFQRVLHIFYIQNYVKDQPLLSVQILYSSGWNIPVQITIIFIERKVFIT